MFSKLAFAQRVLRAMAEKNAGWKVPLLIGAGLAAGYHGVKKGLRKGREYYAEMQPGVAETRAE
jgi:hypothetical protein